MKKFIQNLLENPKQIKTTISGVMLIISSITYGINTEDFTMMIEGIIGGVGLIFIPDFFTKDERKNLRKKVGLRNKIIPIFILMSFNSYAQNNGTFNQIRGRELVPLSETGSSRYTADSVIKMLHNSTDDAYIHINDIPLPEYIQSVSPPVNPAGSDQQLQYNNNGVFGGTAGFNYDGTNLIGVAGYFQQDQIRIDGEQISRNGANYIDLAPSYIGVRETFRPIISEQLGANGAFWSALYLEDVIYTDAQQLQINDTLIQDYIGYFSSNIVNLEDVGANVANSVTGTGFFQWEDIRLDGSEILESGTSIIDLDAAGFISFDRNLNFGSNQTIIIPSDPSILSRGALRYANGGSTNFEVYETTGAQWLPVFALTDGEATTANGTAVDFGGTWDSNITATSTGGDVMTLLTTGGGGATRGEIRLDEFQISLTTDSESFDKQAQIRSRLTGGLNKIQIDAYDFSGVNNDQLQVVYNPSNIQYVIDDGINSNTINYTPSLASFGSDLSFTLGTVSVPNAPTTTTDGALRYDNGGSAILEVYDVGLAGWQSVGSAGIVNLQDNGASVENSVTGTGNFTWENITMDGNAITSNSANDLDISSSSGLIDLMNDVSITGGDLTSTGNNLFVAASGTVVLPIAPTTTITGGLRYNSSNVEVYDGGWSPVGAGIQNLIDVGANVTESLSGTGYLEWDNVRIDLNNISNNSGSLDIESLNIDGSVLTSAGGVSFGSNIIPNANNTIDIGITGTNEFRNGYFEGNVSIGDINIGGQTVQSTTGTLGFTSSSGVIVVNDNLTFQATQTIAVNAAPSTTLNGALRYDNSANQLLQVYDDGLAGWQDVGAGVENLEDNGANVTESASGTGFFQWDDIRIDNAIISNPNGTSISIPENVALSGNDLTGVDDITPNATNVNITSLIINDAYTLPTSDGTGNQVLQTNGSGTVSFASLQTITDYAPTISFSGGTTGITYTDQEGTCIQTLRAVNCYGRILVSNKGTSVGDLQINVPISILEPSGIVSGVGTVSLISVASGYVEVPLYAGATSGDSFFRPFTAQTNTGTTGVETTNGDVDTAFGIYFNVSYLTN